jgi:hypothetical protein
MTARDLLPTIREVARRLEVSEERAAESVGSRTISNCWSYKGNCSFAARSFATKFARGDRR